MKTLETRCVGNSYRSARAQALLPQLNPGAELKLVREADNEWDSNAIQVIAEDPETGLLVHIGYIPAEDNEELAADMDTGAEPVCRVSPYGGPRTLGIEVEW